MPMNPKVPVLPQVLEPQTDTIVSLCLPDDPDLIEFFINQAFKYLQLKSYYKFTGNDDYRQAAADLWYSYYRKNMTLECGMNLFEPPPATIIPRYCVGQIKWLAVDYVPENHLRCDGRKYHRDTYPELYESISAVFRDGDYFYVPDLRSRVVGGADNSNKIGSVSGEDLRLMIQSEIARHAHAVTGTVENRSVPHDHGGTTLSGNATFYRAVGTAGTSTQPNHVTGFSSGSFEDRTDTNYPLRLHNHDILLDDIIHDHEININSQFFPQGVNDQTPMDMRQSTSYIHAFICAGSLKSNGEGAMYFLRQRGSLVEQTVNNGADFFPAFNLDVCYRDPNNGEPIGTDDLNIAIDNNITIENQIVNGTYDYGDWSDNAIPTAQIEEAICSVVLQWVKSVVEYLRQNPPSDLPAICDTEKLAIATGVTGAIATALAGTPLAPIAGAFAALSVGLAVGTALCEIAEEIEPLFTDTSWLTDQSAINEVVCFMSANINAPVTTEQINRSLDGFTGSSNAQNIAAVMENQVTDPAVVGEIFKGAEQAVSLAGTENLPCPCTDVACSTVDFAWRNVPNPPFYPDDWSLGTQTYSDTAISFSRTANGEYRNDAPYTTISIVYTFPEPCFINTLRMSFTKNDSSFVVGAFVQTPALGSVWVRINTGSFGTPLVQSHRVPVGLEVTSINFILWAGDITWNDVAWD